MAGRGVDDDLHKRLQQLQGYVSQCLVDSFLQLQFQLSLPLSHFAYASRNRPVVDDATLHARFEKLAQPKMDPRMAALSPEEQDQELWARFARLTSPTPASTSSSQTTAQPPPAPASLASSSSSSSCASSSVSSASPSASASLNESKSSASALNSSLSSSSSQQPFQLQQQQQSQQQRRQQRATNPALWGIGVGVGDRETADDILQQVSDEVQLERFGAVFPNQTSTAASTATRSTAAPRTSSAAAGAGADARFSTCASDAEADADLDDINIAQLMRSMQLQHQQQHQQAAQQHQHQRGKTDRGGRDGAQPQPRVDAGSMEQEIRRMMQAFSDELQCERRKASAPFRSSQPSADDAEDGEEHGGRGHGGEVGTGDIDLDNEEDAEAVATIVAQARDEALLDRAIR